MGADIGGSGAMHDSHSIVRELKSLFPFKLLNMLVMKKIWDRVDARNRLRASQKAIRDTADAGINKAAMHEFSEYMKSQYNPIYHDTMPSQYDIQLGKKEFRNAIAGYGAEYDSPYETKQRAAFIKLHDEAAGEDRHGGELDPTYPRWWSDGLDSQLSTERYTQFRDDQDLKQYQSYLRQLQTQFQKVAENPTIKAYWQTPVVPLNFREYSLLQGMYTHTYTSTLVKYGATSAEWYEQLAISRAKYDGDRLHTANGQYFGYVDWRAAGIDGSHQTNLWDTYRTAMRGGRDATGNVIRDHNGNSLETRFGANEFYTQNREIVKNALKGFTNRGPDGRVLGNFDMVKHLMSHYIAHLQPKRDANGNITDMEEVNPSITDNLARRIWCMDDPEWKNNTACVGTSQPMFYVLSEVNGEMAEELIPEILREKGLVAGTQEYNAEEQKLRAATNEMKYQTRTMYSPEAQENMYLEASRSYLSTSHGVKVWFNIYGKQGPKKDATEACAAALRHWCLENPSDLVMGQESISSTKVLDPTTGKMRTETDYEFLHRMGMHEQRDILVGFCDVVQNACNRQGHHFQSKYMVDQLTNAIAKSQILPAIEEASTHAAMDLQNNLRGEGTLIGTTLLPSTSKHYVEPTHSRQENRFHRIGSFLRGRRR